MLVDSHCHLTAEQFAGDRAAVLERAWAAGLGHIVVIGESPGAAAEALRLAADEPRLSATAGIHPHDAATWTPDSELWLRRALADERVVAAGEMGLDYHYDHSPRDRQREAFDRQLALAAEAGKAAVIHAREADQDVAAILANHSGATIVLHSFSGGPTLLSAALDHGYYVSFSGMVTFGNWGRDDAVRAVPRERLLLETDAPYLAPVPHRGRRCEPGFVRHTADRVALVRGEPIDELVARTAENARRVFGVRVGQRP
ncbi:MAG TPA: TatD family hydrolase [Gemmatimonadales bacterium]|nr:TatD family hydrolase [Gemmatimonadales bacterium]